MWIQVGLYSGRWRRLYTIKCSLSASATPHRRARLLPALAQNRRNNENHRKLGRLRFHFMETDYAAAIAQSQKKTAWKTCGGAVLRVSFTSSARDDASSSIARGGQIRYNAHRLMPFAGSVDERRTGQPTRERRWRQSHR